MATSFLNGKKNNVLHLISAGNTFAFPVETAGCDGGDGSHGGNGGGNIVVPSGGGSLNRGGLGHGGGGCVESGLDVNVRLSGDIFMDIRFSLGPGLTILVKSSIGNGGGLNNGGKLLDGSKMLDRGNGGGGPKGINGCGGNGVTGGGGVPGSSELGLGSLHLRGVSNVILGKGAGGHGQGSENNL